MAPVCVSAFVLITSAGSCVDGLANESNPDLKERKTEARTVQNISASLLAFGWLGAGCDG